LPDEQTACELVEFFLELRDENFTASTGNRLTRSRIAALGRYAMTILKDPKCNDVRQLYLITKAVYVMESGSAPVRYRVGCVGGEGNRRKNKTATERKEKKTSNDALRRLGQCMIDRKTKVITQWHYLLIKVLDGKTPARDVSDLEEKLREATILSGGAFAKKRIGQSDSFTWKSTGEISDVFQKVVQF